MRVTNIQTINFGKVIELGDESLEAVSLQWCCSQAAGDSMTRGHSLNGMSFTTRAVVDQGAWWYNSYTYSNLNGPTQTSMIKPTPMV